MIVAGFLSCFSIHLSSMHHCEQVGTNILPSCINQQGIFASSHLKHASCLIMPHAHCLMRLPIERKDANNSDCNTLSTAFHTLPYCHAHPLPYERGIIKHHDTYMQPMWTCKSFNQIHLRHKPVNIILHIFI